MLWLKKIPWLSLSILILAYGTFGWTYASWAVKFIDQGKLLYWIVEKDIFTILIYGLGSFWVLIVALAFTAPIALMTISIGSWFNSDARAFMSIILGAMAFALIVQWLDLFSRFFVLLASAILVRIDLRTAGLSMWISLLIIGCFCLLGFGGGIIAFISWG